jgi:hypothetical protein
MKIIEWLGLAQEAKEFSIVLVSTENKIHKNDIETLSRNINLYTQFAIEAHRIKSKGRHHYSARTIIEFLRHETAIHDNNLDFKINNNIAPLLAKVSMFMFPELKGLFHTRDQRAA